MTENNPAIARTDTLALRLIMAFYDKDHDSMNNTLRDIGAAVREDAHNLPLVCVSLAQRAVSALTAISNDVGDNEFGANLIQKWLQENLRPDD